MSRRWIAIFLVATLASVGAWNFPAHACPFCSAVSQTFSEEIDSMDVVVIARLVEPPPPAKPGDRGDEVPRAKFAVERAIKGESLLSDKQTIDTIYFGDGKKGTRFLIMGVDPPQLMWSTPLQLSERGHQYIMHLSGLPAEGAERLRFFQNHLEDEDEMLARDAYDEFARSPYDAVKGLKEHMNKPQLLAWIQDPDVPASRRRLYLTMLGVCGGEADLPLLENMLKSDDRKMKSGLDALIGCYLTLKGAAGLPLVEELFLKDEKAEYADTYAAIMALRFHGTEGGVIDRERVVQSLHYMLDRPQLADLVIPDLARWEDWSQMEKLVELFKTSDDKTSWVRVPVVNYLRASPKPEAKEYLKELEEIDPASVKRANTFFPFNPTGSDKSSPPKSSQRRPAPDAIVAAETAIASANTAQETLPARANVAQAGKNATVAAGSLSSAGLSTSTAASGGTSAERLSSPTLAVVPIADAPNRIVIVGVAWVAGIILLLLQWTLLSGARSS